MSAVINCFRKRKEERGYITPGFLINFYLCMNSKSAYRIICIVFDWLSSYNRLNPNVVYLVLAYCDEFDGYDMFKPWLKIHFV